MCRCLKARRRRYDEWRIEKSEVTANRGAALAGNGPLFTREQCCLCRDVIKPRINFLLRCSTAGVPSVFERPAPPAAGLSLYFVSAATMAARRGRKSSRHRSQLDPRTFNDISGELRVSRRRLCAGPARETISRRLASDSSRQSRGNERNSR